MKNKIINGAKWLTLSNIFNQIIQVLSIVFIARLLDPETYGLFAILMIFVGFLKMFVGMGTSAAIVQNNHLNDKFLSTIFYFNLTCGLIVYFVLFLSSGYIATFFNNIEIENLLKIIGLLFIITAISSVQNALFTKNMHFKYMSVIQSFALIVSFIIGLSFAYLGHGVYSLIYKSLSEVIIVTVLTWFISDWRPKFYFSLQVLKGIYNYSSNLVWFSIINYFSRNSDNFLIGKFLGEKSLGAYNMAYNLMLYPLNNISHTLVRVLFPAMSELKENNELIKKYYIKVIFFISLITFPLMLGLMSVSEIFVDVVFGDKWKELSTLIIILSPIGLLQSIGTTVGSIYMAKGTTSLMFKIGLLNSIIQIVSIIIGLQYGVKGVAISYLIANIFLFLPNLYVAWKQIDLKLIEGLKESFFLLIISVIMAIIVYIVGILLEDIQTGGVFKLLFMICVGAISYAIMIKIRYKSFSSLINQVKTTKGKQ